MTQITFIDHAGTATTLDAPDGWSLMQAATAHGVDGIVGECGGSCACATCHCYLGDGLLALIPAAGENELGMLENVVAERRAGSRLACQVKVSPAMAGAQIHLPECQE